MNNSPATRELSIIGATVALLVLIAVLIGALRKRRS